MAVIVDGNGNFIESWEDQYKILRDEVVEVCSTWEKDDPDVVLLHVQHIEIDLGIEAQPCCEPGIDISWSDRKDEIVLHAILTENLLEFADPVRFGSVMERLWKLRNMIYRLSQLIEENNA